MIGQSLRGRRLMIVEDEFLVAMLLEGILEDEGAVIVGPFGRVPPAIEAAEQAELDLAVLDVNVAGEKVYPVAEALARRGVPFLLLSGYGDTAAPDHPDWPVCSKPFERKVLLERLSLLLAPVG